MAALTAPEVEVVINATEVEQVAQESKQELSKIQKELAGVWVGLRVVGCVRMGMGMGSGMGLGMGLGVGMETDAAATPSRPSTHAHTHAHTRTHTCHCASATVLQCAVQYCVVPRASHPPNHIPPTHNETHNTHPTQRDATHSRGADRALTPRTSVGNLSSAAFSSRLIWQRAVCGVRCVVCGVWCVRCTVHGARCTVCTVCGVRCAPARTTCHR